MAAKNGHLGLFRLIVWPEGILPAYFGFGDFCRLIFGDLAGVSDLWARLE